MSWIIVRNWEKFQHYRDRNVPWIKFYTELTSDDAWRNLTHHQRGVLCGLWLEYASSRCQLPLDTTARRRRQLSDNSATTRRQRSDSLVTLSRRLGQRVMTRDLKALRKAGFIEVCSRPNLDHVKIASRPTRARKEEETERREENPPLTPPRGKEQAKKKDELWDILVEELGEVQTDSERGRRNKALKELRDADATPDDLRFAIRVYRELWPAITLTASGLAANWTMLMNGSSRTPAFKFHCAECGVGVNTEQRLTEHMENVHGVWA